MSTTVSIPAARRTHILAAASALVAAASVTVTLAVSGGGGDVASSQPSAAPATATPDRATLYRNAVEAGRESGPVGGPSTAERFHHFR
jgi:hypothetical protein